MNTGQATMPPYGGRRQHEIPYNAPSQPPFVHQFHQYNQHVPRHFQPHLPPQWAYYPNMPPNIPRAYPHQYPPMINASYSMPHTLPPHSPRPGQPQLPPPPSTAYRPHPVHYTSPAPPNSAPHPPPHPPPPPPPPSIATTSIPPQAIISAPTTPGSPVPPTEPEPHTQIASSPISAYQSSPLHIAVNPSMRTPFYPLLPWYSTSEHEFLQIPSRRRRRKLQPQSSVLSVELPPRTTNGIDVIEGHVPEVSSSTLTQDELASKSPRTVTMEFARSETPATSQAPSETDSTQPTTPSSTFQQRISRPASNARQSAHSAILLPAVPTFPSTSRAAKARTEHFNTEAENQAILARETRESPATKQETKVGVVADPSSSIESSAGTTNKTQVPPPKSWADLVRSKVKEDKEDEVSSVAPPQIEAGGHRGNKPVSISTTLTNFNIEEILEENEISFIRPRGLVNTGNMCYMNSILQILLFCVPFYNFLTHFSKNTNHSFKSDNPMIDVIILFMQEFPIIASASSVGQLKARLKEAEIGGYGEAFIPEFVYEVIRNLPRFSTMRRGHQQDAEEFLGFLLEEMHEECMRLMKGLPADNSSATAGLTGLISYSNSSVGSNTTNEDQGWLEVGPRQKASVTRNSGLVSRESPIAKIFGGRLRSELRVPGMKPSVTFEPYQPLQLDIGAASVRTITDALKGLTHPEVLHGDFNSPRGPGASATKQVFIEDLPPVLILHLKRFQYDNTGGTQKIWKKIGYPLDLQIPKEVFPPHKRNIAQFQSNLPRYHLIGVVYHHGKSAGGGHYTVDVRRQDEREWIRLDDTIIRRIRIEDVTESGQEDDSKHHEEDSDRNRSVEGLGADKLSHALTKVDHNQQPQRGWRQVNGSGTIDSGKRSGSTNGASNTGSTGQRTPLGHFSTKENKVAYILFYQRS